MHKGQLKTWRGDKGFGFIQSDELKQDTFIHISSLTAMSRKPKVGDFIYFEVKKQTKGKNKAINCRIEGVATKSIKRPKPRIQRNTSRPKSKIISVLIVIAIAAFAIQRLGLVTTSKTSIPATISSPVQQQSTLERAFSENNAEFSCDGRQHCSQMKSRAEAVYFMNHCPNTKMDGDNDGRPCENDSRF
jgi:cold shock CspA family protein